MTRLLGAVLAGGQSRRFGSDKAVADLASKPLIAHSIIALRAQTDGIVVCGREWPGVTGIPDRPKPGLGPLGGLNAALHHARARGFDAVLTLGCDTPRVPADLSARLAAAGPAAFVAALPIIGLWPASLAEALDQYLGGANDRSVRGWARSVGAAPVELPETIENINFPSDLIALKAGS